MKASAETQIKELEKCIAMGDIPGMARMIGQLHERWDELSGDVQKDILKLEAIFLSLVDAKAGESA